MNRRLGEVNGCVLFVLQCPRCKEYDLTTAYPKLTNGSYRLTFICQNCKENIPKKEVFEYHEWLEDELKPKSKEFQKDIKKSE